MKINYTAGEEANGKTVKHVLKCNLSLSEKLIKKLKFNQKILCNSVPVFVNHVVKKGDFIEVCLDLHEECENIMPENIPLHILYEDEGMIVINKQPNIVVHPTFNHPNGTIANALMHHYNSIGTSLKVRPVSRLDRDTSGIIIFAKNSYVQDSLIRQMNTNTFRKEYLGIVYGPMESLCGTINLPIARKEDSIMLRCVSPDGQPAITHYECIEQLKGASLVRFRLETGRTHQIRVHCQAIGHPLVGESLYSTTPLDFMQRQALHSCKAGFIHPYTLKYMELTAPFPEDMQKCLEILRK